MRLIFVYAFAVVLAIGTGLLVPDSGARASASGGPLPTVEEPSVGNMKRIIIPAEGAPVPSVKSDITVKSNNQATRPANSQAPARANLGSTAQVPVQSMIDRTVRAGAGAATNPLPLQ